jgi:SAM-dependent methyltransferase
MKSPKMKKALKQLTRHRFGFCTVCGRSTLFVLIDPECLRNTMICLFCRSAARNRHVAKALLDIVPGSKRSMAELQATDKATIYNTAADDCFSRVLKNYQGYFSSCYRDDLAPGAEISPRTSCQNIEALTYPDGSFDFVITEDVFEHVRHYEKGFQEIFRVLRPGGYHVFTVPFHFDRPTVVRVDTSGAEDVHLLPPEYHGDPLRGRILAYRTFGIDLFEQLDAIGFQTRVHFSTVAERKYGIWDSSVFISQRVN